MIEWTFSGLIEARRRALEREKRAASLVPAFLRVDKLVSQMFVRQFTTAGRWGGAPWAPLRPATRRARVRPGGNRGGLSRPLWDTSRLKASLEKVGPESVRVVRPRLYQRGTSVPYAQYHQEGFSVVRWGRVVFQTPRRVPARPIIPDPLPEEFRRTLGRVVMGHLLGGEA